MTITTPNATSESAHGRHVPRLAMNRLGTGRSSRSSNSPFIIFEAANQSRFGSTNV
jgi:hypothetical protein